MRKNKTIIPERTCTLYFYALHREKHREKTKMVAEKCSSNCFSLNFRFGIPPFSKWKFSFIQKRKFPFLKINVNNRSIFKQKIQIKITDTERYLHGTIICIDYYYSRFFRIAFLRIRTLVLDIIQWMRCYVN